MIAALGWLWAWVYDPAEMMRQRRERLWWVTQFKAQKELLILDARREQQAHFTTMTRRRNNEWVCECTCGWLRLSFLDTSHTAKVRQLCDEHDATHE
jgi:hypothetical protein